MISIKKNLNVFSKSSAAPFYPSGLQWVKNAQKVEIENRPWPYFFSQLDPMLFRVFSLKLTKETPCGHRQVNSKIFIFCLITTPRYYRPYIRADMIFVGTFTQANFKQTWKCRECCTLLFSIILTIFLY